MTNPEQTAFFWVLFYSLSLVCVTWVPSIHCGHLLSRLLQRTWLLRRNCSSYYWGSGGQPYCNSHVGQCTRNIWHSETKIKKIALKIAPRWKVDNQAFGLSNWNCFIYVKPILLLDTYQRDCPEVLCCTIYNKITFICISPYILI